MMRLGRLWVIVATVVSLLALDIVAAEPALAEEPVNPVALLQGVENARLQLPPSKLEIFTDFKSAKISRNDRYEVVFSRDKRRFMEHVDSGVGICSIFDGKEALIWDGSSATINDMAQPTGAFLFDPRTLGISTNYFWGDSIQSSLGYHNAKSISLIGREDVERRKTWHVTVVDSYDQQKDFWIAPEAGFPVLRHEFAIGPWHNITTSEYENVDSSFVAAALPKRTKTEGYVTDRPSFVRTISIERVESETPIGASTWTLTGLNLPVGAAVSDLRAHKRIGFWDGRGLSNVPAGPHTNGPNRRELAPRYALRRLFIANLMAIGVVIAIVCHVRRKRRSGG